jgi:hypothetical protein
MYITKTTKLLLVVFQSKLHPMSIYNTNSVVSVLSIILEKELGLAHLVKGVNIHPDHPGLSPLWREFM